MRKRISIFITLSFMVLALVSLPLESVSADIADGTYDVPYEVIEAGSNNVSIADGYFVKPAKLIVENGEKFVELTLTSSHYIKSLSGPYGDVSVISENEENHTRVVRMKVGDLSQPVQMGMHIVVPEEIAGMPYDNDHTARAVFDISNIDSSGENQTSTTGSADGSDEVNPPTGDNTPITLYVTLILSSIVIFTVYKLRFAKD